MDEAPLERDPGALRRARPAHDGRWRSSQNRQRYSDRIARSATLQTKFSCSRSLRGAGAGKASGATARTG